MGVKPVIEKPQMNTNGAAQRRCHENILAVPSICNLLAVLRHTTGTIFFKNQAYDYIIITAS